jgi:pimeloyl-ACP methyl ester carboxylesterase
MTTATVRLPDGRTLAFVDRGDRNGRPVVFCHGLWNSRSSHGPAPERCERLGVRFIAPDRPGIGLSDPGAPGGYRRWTDDVVALADALSFEQFGVIGFSGGAPYALACGAAIPDRVIAVAVAGAYPPLDGPGMMGPLRRDLASVLRLARVAPWALRLAFSMPARALQRDPITFARRRARGAPECDRVAGERPDVFERAALGTAEALRQGTRAVAHDFTLLARPWDFALSEVQVPVHVLHGAADRDAPVVLARRLHDELPVSTLEIVDDRGHLVMLDRWDELLGAAAGEGERRVGGR